MEGFAGEAFQSSAKLGDRHRSNPFCSVGFPWTMVHSTYTQKPYFSRDAGTTGSVLRFRPSSARQRMSRYWIGGDVLGADPMPFDGLIAIRTGHGPRGLADGLDRPALLKAFFRSLQSLVGGAG